MMKKKTLVFSQELVLKLPLSFLEPPVHVSFKILFKYYNCFGNSFLAATLYFVPLQMVLLTIYPV